MRSSSSLTVNSIASASLPVSFFTTCFCVFVRSIRTMSFSLLIAAPSYRSERRYYGTILRDRHLKPISIGLKHLGRSDPLFELANRQLDRVGVLPRLLLQDFLLGLRQIDANELFLFAHGGHPSKGGVGIDSSIERMRWYF